jgi:hypothetical protein
MPITLPPAAREAARTHLYENNHFCLALSPEKRII